MQTNSYLLLVIKFDIGFYFSYLAPEDDSISCELDEKKSDVYSFGILIMEIVTGKMPVDHSQPHVSISSY